MRFNTPLKTVMVLTLLTCPAVLPADPTRTSPSVGKYQQGAIGLGSNSRNVRSSEQPKLTDGSTIARALVPKFSSRLAAPELSAETQARITRLQALLKDYSDIMAAAVGVDPGLASLGRTMRAARQSELYQLQNPSTNTITGRARDGTETTIYCNPGPCTMGSVLRHVRLSGLPEMVPLTLYSAVSDLEGGFDSAFEETKRVMQTSEFRGTDANAESAYRVPAYTTILAEVSRRRELNENNNGKVVDGVLMDVTVQYEPPETTTVTTYVDAAETEEQRKTREDRAEADRLVQAFEQRLATNLARDAQRRADNPGPVTPVVTQPTMPAAPTW